MNANGHAAVHNTPFGRTVLELEERAGRGSLPIALSKTTNMGRWTGRRIEVSADLLDTSDEYQHWVAAHEVAHAALRHDRPPWWFWSALGLCSLLVICIGAVPTALGIQGRIAALLVMLTVLATNVLVFGIAVWRLSASKRSLETAADQLALTWGYPLTAKTAQRLLEEEGDGAHARFQFLRQHPHPQNRINTFSAARGAPSVEDV